MSNLNSLESTIENLKEIVLRNQGTNHEAVQMMRQIEMTLSEIERKTRKNSPIVVAPQAVHVQGVPIA